MMIHSMTGYGHAQEVMGGREVTVELRSVNHRFFELSCRVPRAYGYLEEKIKSYLKSSVSRGKVDVFVSVVTLEGKDALVEINHTLAAGYIGALRELAQRFDLSGDLSASDIARFSDIFAVRKEEEDEEQIWNMVQSVLESALKGFLSMRAVEGEKLVLDLNARLDDIMAKVTEVERRSPQRVSEYRQRLLDKMNEVLGETGIDQQRILTEAAIFAERIAVDEETVRLRSHVSQFKSVLGEGGNVGRKLDFMVQELNREANTIGSKANDFETAQTVVDIKSEIEKIREQIQNIE